MAFASRHRLQWQLRSRALALGERTLLMAIVNLTPDSFSGDGLAGRGREAAVEVACAAVDGGADLIDLGAESTRPAATPVDAGEEQDRLLPVLEAVRHARPHAVISVDTYQAATALAAGAAGAEIINDVSGLQWDRGMADAVAVTGCGLVLMHTRGTPAQWAQQGRLRREAMLDDVLSGLRNGLNEAEAAGVRRERIVLDPGFGFGKRGAENFALLTELPRLREFGQGLLIGLSRKGFLAEAVQPVQPRVVLPPPISVARRDATFVANVAANVAAILAGAHILRVHDLQAAREAAAVADAVLRAAELEAG